MITYAEMTLPEAPKTVTVIALDSSQTVPTVVGALSFTTLSSGQQMIHFVYVLPEYRGQGLYSGLVDYVRTRYAFRTAVTPHIPTAAALWYTLRGIYVYPGLRLDEGDLGEARLRRRAQEIHGASVLESIASSYHV